MTKTNERNCLFIAYDYPPCKFIGGALRSFYFTKYMPAWGWNPEVVSIEERGMYYRSINGDTRLPSLTPYNKPYEMTPYGWAINLYRHYGQKIIGRPFELIYVSCPPFPQAYTAVLLKKKFQCSLVVDFRDAWSLDPYMEGSRLKRFLYKCIFPVLERNILREANAFIVNTPSMKHAYEKQYSFLTNKTFLIPNGFDENEFRCNPQPRPSNEPYALVYCGRFGIGGRSPELIMKAIRKFVEKYGNTIEFRIIGDESPFVKQHVADMKLEHVVHIAGTVPHKEAITNMFNADALLLYQENSGALISAVAGKTYEYLRTGKPILAIAPHGDNLNLVDKFASRCEMVSDFRVDSVVASLEKLYIEWKDGRQSSHFVAKSSFISQYNRESLTKQLIDCFDTLMVRDI